MDRTIIYRVQRTVTDVRTKEGMKAHVDVCGEIARVRGQKGLDFQVSRQIRTQNLADRIRRDRRRNFRSFQVWFEKTFI